MQLKLLSGKVTAMQKIQWQISVPIFRNSLILKQLGLAIGIPFGLITLVLAFSAGKRIYALYGLALIGLLLFLTWAFVMIIFRGKYEAEFILDDKGVLCRTQSKQAKKNRLINRLAIVLGLLSAQPAAAGSGMLAQSRQEVFLPWRQINKVKYNKKGHTILLRSGWLNSVALFCVPENYPQIESIIMQQTAQIGRV